VGEVTLLRPRLIGARPPSAVQVPRLPGRAQPLHAARVHYRRQQPPAKKWPPPLQPRPLSLSLSLSPPLQLPCVLAPGRTRPTRERKREAFCPAWGDRSGALPDPAAAMAAARPNPRLGLRGLRAPSCARASSYALSSSRLRAVLSSPQAQALPYRRALHALAQGGQVQQRPHPLLRRPDSDGAAGSPPRQG